MENISFPNSVAYASEVKAAKRFLFRLPFVEYHPETLTYEEVQAVDAKLLRLDDDEVFNEFAGQEVKLEVVKRIFRGLLDDCQKTENWRDAPRSLYYDEAKIVSRLQQEGRDEKYISFYLGQLYKVQQTIMERTETIRQMVRWWENPDEANSRRTINEQELKKYFSASFFGAGMSSNYWALEFLPSLKKERKAIDWARIAALIYSSRYMNRKTKPVTFKSWYRAFCGLIGAEYRESLAKESKAKATEAIMREFAYL